MKAFHNHRPLGDIMLLLFVYAICAMYAMSQSSAFTISTRSLETSLGDADDDAFTLTSTTDATTADDGANTPDGALPAHTLADAVPLVDTSTYQTNAEYETSTATERTSDNEIDSSNSSPLSGSTSKAANDLENITFDDNINTDATTSANEEAAAESTDLTTSANVKESSFANSEGAQNAFVMKIQSSLAKQNRSTDGDSSTVRSKNPDLYTVKPTYKRPKILDISTPVSHKRDPNDNSWRNESISSLGIVFKASNVSKPFTLIAKEKTESELIATMQKFDNEDDETPELKQRLEILSERRKMKKKPDTIDDEDKDDDYEEIHYPDATTKEPKTPEEATTRKDEDAQTIPASRTSFASATTETPKMMNLFDDYDDEKQMAIIELNKYPTEKAPTTPSPAHQYAPERKPTLQYFPPRKTTRRKPLHVTPPTAPLAHVAFSAHGFHPHGHEGSRQPPYYPVAESEFRKDIHYAGYEGDHDTNILIAAVPYSDPGRAPASYPVLYNNSVVHYADGPGRLSSSSSAFMKRLYGSAGTRGGQCDDCVNVDLSPDYELHYYVPDVEERQQFERAPSASSRQTHFHNERTLTIYSRD